MKTNRPLGCQENPLSEILVLEELSGRDGRGSDSRGYGQDARIANDVLFQAIGAIDKRIFGNLWAETVPEVHDFFRLGFKQFLPLLTIDRDQRRLDSRVAQKARRVGLHQTDLLLELRGFEGVVGVQVGDIIARGLDDPESPCATNAQVDSAGMSQQSYPAVSTRDSSTISRERSREPSSTTSTSRSRRV